MRNEPQIYQITFSKEGQSISEHMIDGGNGHELLLLSWNILGSNTERRKNPDFVGS